MASKIKVYGQKHLSLSNIDVAIQELQDIKAQSVAEAWIECGISIESDDYAIKKDYEIETKAWWYRYETDEEQTKRLLEEKEAVKAFRQKARERKKKKEEQEKKEYERLKKKFEQ